VKLLYNLFTILNIVDIFFILCDNGSNLYSIKDEERLSMNVI
jgi:hypothetical protein